MRRRSFLLASAAVTASRAFPQEPDETAGPDWFPFEPDDDFTGPSVIGMADWLERPAGKHGFVQVRGDRLVFEDGTPVKFWGTNVCNRRVARPKPEADRVADRFAKYGVNLVRMHKFTWPGERAGIGSGADSTQLEEPLARQWDYFSAALAGRGIYSAWSHIFGHRLSPADRDRVAAYDELMNADLPWDYLRRSTVGLVNFAPDLQRLNIALTVNMLNRVNTATGHRYAEDSALAFIELQNEDDIFWAHTQIYLDRCPTYKKMLHEQFSVWLRARYGSEEKLRAEWGSDALAAGESFDRQNIAASATPEISARIRKTVAAGDAPPSRLLDNCLFLHETQNRFYSRFIEAIRATGYKGAIVGSCWQAGSGVSHYYNLLSDRMAGLVDRHNYSGGVRAMVSVPGSGLLGTGVQQVSDRPFGISEWKSTLGNPWQAEAPAIVAAYGMGLQGWDMSAEFASDFDTMRGPMTTYGVDSPADMGQFPVLARMVYRGDVRESPVIAARNVAFTDLVRGRLGFEDQVRQRGDVKDFTGTISAVALAVGRVVVDFVNEPAATVAPNLDRFVDPVRKVARSATGQLLWNHSERGFFTIDTLATQAVIGFAAGPWHELSDVSIRIDTPFALVYVSSLDRRLPIAKANALLVLAIARTANTGMRVAADGKVIERGIAPVLIEPVRATLRLRRGRGCSAHALDHDGRRNAEAAPVDLRQTPGGAEMRIDGATFRALYYLIEYQS